MAAHHPGTGVLCAVAFAHEPGPEAASGAEFGDFFEEIVVYVEEEGETRSKLIDFETALKCSVNISKAVGDGEGQFLDSGRPRFADVIAADTDGVPTRHVAC